MPIIIIVYIFTGIFKLKYEPIILNTKIKPRPITKDFISHLINFNIFNLITHIYYEYFFIYMFYFFNFLKVKISVLSTVKGLIDT